MVQQTDPYYLRFSFIGALRPSSVKVFLLQIHSKSEIIYASHQTPIRSVRSFTREFPSIIRVIVELYKPGPAQVGAISKAQK